MLASFIQTVQFRPAHAVYCLHRQSDCAARKIRHKMATHMSHGTRTATDNAQLLWIDCDAGVDDAQGIMLALSKPSSRLMGISCVFGNTAVTQVAANAARVLTLYGRQHDVPVYRGAWEPLITDLYAPASPSGSWFGQDGLGDAPEVPPTPSQVTTGAADGIAAVRLVECAQQHEGQLTVVATGPLTNIALACKLDPDFPSRLRRLYVMGGAESAGNASPTAEFNFHCDPEAAKIVMNRFAACSAPAAPLLAQPQQQQGEEGEQSGHPSRPSHLSQYPLLALISVECAERHAVPWEAVDEWMQRQGPKATFLAGIARSSLEYARKQHTQSGQQGAGWVVWDPLAVAVALQPDIVTQAKQVYCDVEIRGSELTRGMAVFDWGGRLKRRPNVELIQSVSIEAFTSMLDESLQ